MLMKVEQFPYSCMIDINKLISEAMKSKNTVALNAYKNLKAEIQLAKTAKNAKPYDDIVESSVILKYCKKLGDAITEFKEAGRDDLVKDYENELSVLSTLLPKVPNDAEILGCIREWMAGAEFIPQKSFGQVMKYVKTKLPLADGSSVSRIVKGLIREA